jgi:hypothetical protein
LSDRSADELLTGPATASPAALKPLPELRPLYEAVYASNLTVFYEWRVMAMTKFLVFSDQPATARRRAPLGWVFALPGNAKFTLRGWAMLSN